MKQYKIYTLYTLLLFIILMISLLFYLSNAKIYFSHREFPIWVDVKQKLSKTNKENFILLGDSRAKAGFKPKTFDFANVSSLNLAIGGGTPIEAYYALRQYLKKNKPEFLLLSYAPFHIQTQDSYWGRTVLFDFLNLSEYYEITNHAKKFKEQDLLEKNLNENYYFFTYVNYTKNPFKFLPSLKKALFTINNRYSVNNRILKYLKETKGHFFYGRALQSSGITWEGKQKEPFVNSTLINFYLEKLIVLAQSNNIKVYYYSMPFNKSTYRSINVEYVNSYNSYISNLAKKYNIKILNSLYFLPNENFGDASHLYRGAEKVTLHIRDQFIKSFL